MDENQFDKLRKHLKVLYPIFEEFCLRTGYQFVNPVSIGRYPRIRVEQANNINRWIDLWMALDENGNRYSEFFDDIPYELTAGAYVDIKDSTKYGHRYQKSFILFARKPYTQLKYELHDALSEAENKLSAWNESLLKEKGTRVDLG